MTDRMTAVPGAGSRMRVADVEVFVDAPVERPVENGGADTIVMIHGWPDTHRLWNAQVEALKPWYRCVRFTLPGFDLARRGRAYSLDEVVDTIRAVVEQAVPDRSGADPAAPGRVTLLLHDWGCFYGYQFALRHPHLVARVIGVDIGDAGSRRNRAELGVRAKLMVVGYQWWLALAWRIGGRAGDGMARWMARRLRCPAPSEAIGAQMGYPYAVVWFGVAGGAPGLRSFDPAVPMLFVYGSRKPFMFHSTAWIEKLARRPENRIVALPTGHWVMVDAPDAFNDAILAWLGSDRREGRPPFVDCPESPAPQP